MKWIGSKKQKEAITKDGYHLIIKCLGDYKYAWIVYFKGDLIKGFENKPVYKDSMDKAKRQALRLMVQHMLKKRD